MLLVIPTVTRSGPALACAGRVQMGQKPATGGEHPHVAAHAEARPHRAAAGRKSRGGGGGVGAGEAGCGVDGPARDRVDVGLDPGEVVVVPVLRAAGGIGRDIICLVDTAGCH